MQVTKLPDKIFELIQNKQKLFVGDLPSLSEEGIGIALEEGSENLIYFGQQKTLNKPYIRITIRAKFYNEGMSRAEAIIADIDKYTDEDILQCISAGSPMYIGRNQQKLHEIQLLFYITLK